MTRPAQPRRRRLVTAVTVLGTAVALAATRPAEPVLRLATTTSTEDSGLLSAILPVFRQACDCRVDVIAVGTGQALELGRRGDADVLLVHAPAEEARFIADGHATERFDVMYNDFVIVGPPSDPAHLAGMTAAREAFAAIARARAPFASRGDRSGTHTAELAIWTAAEVAPAGATWYRALGQGMGETLVVANEEAAYALTDRGTFLAMRTRLRQLRVLVGGASLAENRDPALRNRYGVMAVNPAKHPGVNAPLAARFIAWLLSRETQQRIGAFGVERFGQPLFYPDSDEYKATDAVVVTSGPARRTLTLSDLRALPRVTLARHTVVGVKKGPIGPYTWAGASLKDVLLAVDPSAGDARYAGSRIVVTSRDGWTATLLWAELFGTLPRGAALYNVKGCNECHGVQGEGTNPAGKRPAPVLAGRTWDVDRLVTLLRAGGSAHAGFNPYTPAQLTSDDVRAMAGWLQRPDAAGRAQPFRPAPDRRVTLLAYERDGQPLTGRGGLIQLVVGPDEFAGRYSHWVQAIDVVAR